MTSRKPINIRFQLDGETNYRLKVMAVQQDTTKDELIKNILRDFTDEHFSDHGNFPVSPKSTISSSDQSGDSSRVSLPSMPTS